MPGSHPEVVVIGLGVGLEEIRLKLPRWLRCTAGEETHGSGVQFCHPKVSERPRPGAYLNLTT